jgi:hypothetical protein
MRQRTIAAIEPGNFTGILPEFGRTGDVQRIFGLKRGTLYNLHKQRKVRGILVRVAGQKSGVRLWHMTSISAYLNSLLSECFSD